MDIASIGAAVASLSTARDIVKGLQAVAEKLDRAEAKNQLAELLGTLADVRVALSDARDEIAQLREENRRLQQAAEVRGKVVSRDGYYFLSEAVPGYPQGPFCTACLDSRRQLIQVQTARRRSGYEASCPVCNAQFMGQIVGATQDGDGYEPAAGSISFTRG